MLTTLLFVCMLCVRVCVRVVVFCGCKVLTNLLRLRVLVLYYLLIGFTER